MSEHRMPPQAPLPRLEGTLERVCAPITEVSPLFAMVSEPQGSERVYEFQSRRLDSHIIMLDASGNIAAEHAKLQERTNTVFPDMHISDTILLVVPEGARSLRNIVPLLSRDIDNYSDIFDQLGQTLRTLAESRIGLPVGRSVLRRFAFAPDEESPSGGKVFIVPPYGLSEQHDITDVITDLDHELSAQAELTEEQCAQVLEKVKNGWSKIG